MDPLQDLIPTENHHDRHAWLYDWGRSLPSLLTQRFLATVSASKIESALLDVRRAYRLLHEYQRLVLDAVDYIGKEFGLTYVGGWPKFSHATPREGTGQLSNWAWDWLNMVLYEFHFRKTLPDGSRLRFSVLLISDTGYFCAPDDRLEKTRVSGYLPAAKSATKLGFFLSVKEWDVEIVGDKAAMRRFIETGGELPAIFAAKGILGKCVDLANIASEEKTQALLEEIAAFAKSGGIPLLLRG
jgi:hypothetical protein